MTRYPSRALETILEGKRKALNRPVTILECQDPVTQVSGLNALETILEGSEGW